MANTLTLPGSSLKASFPRGSEAICPNACSSIKDKSLRPSHAFWVLAFQPLLEGKVSKKKLRSAQRTDSLLRNNKAFKKPEKELVFLPFIIDPDALIANGFHINVNGLGLINFQKIGMKDRIPCGRLPFHLSVIVDNLTLPG